MVRKGGDRASWSWVERQEKKPMGSAVKLGCTLGVPEPRGRRDRYEKAYSSVCMGAQICVFSLVNSSQNTGF